MGGSGQVATGHPLVTAAAAEILSAGGNAFDAAIAAGFASSAAEPAFTSLGGGGFLLARTSDGRARVYDFFVDTPGRGRPTEQLEPHFVPVTVRFPASEQEFNIGLGSVAVPGNLAGFLQIHETLGRMPLAEVVAPAVRLAHDGVPVGALQAYFLTLLEPIFTFSEGAAAIYAPGGRVPREGDLLRNRDLAATIERLPEDRGRGFHRGAAAKRLLAEMEAGAGLITQEDLSAYRVFEREPLAFDYRGLRMLTNPPPSFGGSLLAESFARLEGVDLGDVRYGSPEHLRAWLSVMRDVEALRVSDGMRRFARGTTHVSVADREGNVASMTTSNGEGSGHVAPGTGILLNNMLGEDDLHPEGFHQSPPGQRVASMMAPTLVLEDDRVRLVLGSGGSKRIRTALLQALSSVIDFGLSVRDAVEAPRVHWDGDRIQAEPGALDAAAAAALADLGPINEWPERDVYFGGVHALEPGRAGAGDPRRGGSAMEVR